MNIIVTEFIHNAGIELLKKHFKVVDCKFNISHKDLLNCINMYDAMIVRSDTKVDKDIIEAGINLKAIGMAGIGLNHIDVEYAKKRNIEIFNVPDGSNDSVAELTMALMLNIIRKVNSAIYTIKFKNKWDKYGFTGRQLKDKVIGIIALGKIGQKVAQYCMAFGMKVIAYDPFLSYSKAKELNIELVSLDELLSKADIISIHAPLTKDTYHLIGEKEIEKMKKDAYLLNLGRGGIVDEESLYKALKEGRLAGAAFDVMEKEPPGNSKLFELENFIITPHIGAGTIEAQEYISMTISQKIVDYLANYQQSVTSIAN